MKFLKQMPQILKLIFLKEWKVLNLRLVICLKSVQVGLVVLQFIFQTKIVYEEIKISL